MKKSSLGIILAGSIFLAIVEVKISIALSQSETLYYFFVRLFEFFSLTYAVYTAILIPLNFAIIYLLFIRQLEKNSQKNGYVRSNPPQDRLERTGLAKNISLKIAHQSLDESLIIGINGRWGSGKTTLADYICKDIETAETNIKIIRYDAWSYPSSEDMSIAFLNELANCIASSIQTKGGKILRRELFNYLEALKKYKNFDLNNTTLNLSHLFSNEGGINLKLMKNELHETFKQNNFRCLVVIDDIDRLDPTQTINIFQTIKNLCDFGGVSYLVLYDKLQVMNCLSFNKIYDGEEYLAKIIEHEVLLPPPAPHQIYELLDSQLLSFTGYNSPRTINPADYKGDYEIAVMALSRGLDNFRAVNRYIQSLSNKLPAIKQGIYFPDVLLMAYLDFSHHEISTEIHKRGNEFFSGTSSTYSDFQPYTYIETDFSEFIDEDKERTFHSDFLEIISEKKYPERKEILLNSIVTKLFPNIYLNYGHINQELESEHRLCLYRNFKQYINTNETYVLGRHEIIKFITTDDQDYRYKIIKDAIDNNELEDLLVTTLGKLKDGVIKFNGLQSFLNVILFLPDSDYIKWNINSLKGELVDLLVLIISKITSPETVKTYIEFILFNANQKIIAHDLLLEFLNINNCWSEGNATWEKFQQNTSLSKADLIDLTETWLSIIDSYKEEILDDPYSHSLLYRWGQLDPQPYVSVKKFLAQSLNKPENLAKFLTPFTKKDKTVAGMEYLIDKEIFNSFPNLEDEIYTDIISELRVRIDTVQTQK